ncbi:MAG TPA: hypothetical protein VI698_02505 [Nitrososphaerales archaeon]|nr:hypothetical protein [Nitrososphaerales archaeon]
MNLRTVDIIVISVIGVIIAVAVITSVMNPGNKDGGNGPNGTNGSVNSEEKALAPASEPVLMDPFGSPVSRIIVNEQVLFQSEITNKQDKKQEFVYVVHVTNSEGITVSLSWFRSELPPNDKFNVSQSWTPDSPGTYDVEIFVWDSIEGQIILSPSRKISVEVES